MKKLIVILIITLFVYVPSVNAVDIAGWVYGTVTDCDGDTISGAYVTYTVEDNEIEAIMIDNNYIFFMPPAWDVPIEVKDSEDEVIKSITMDVLNASMNPVDFVIGCPSGKSMVSGVITNRLGEPIEGVFIYETEVDPSEASGISDSEGFYSFQIESGTTRITDGVTEKYVNVDEGKSTIQNFEITGHWELNCTNCCPYNIFNNEHDDPPDVDVAGSCSPVSNAQANLWLDDIGTGICTYTFNLDTNKFNIYDCIQD
jgi:hypothetical protein